MALQCIQHSAGQHSSHFVCSDRLIVSHGHSGQRVFIPGRVCGPLHHRRAGWCGNFIGGVSCVAGAPIFAGAQFVDRTVSRSNTRSDSFSGSGQHVLACHHQLVECWPAWLSVELFCLMIHTAVMTAAMLLQCVFHTGVMLLRCLIHDFAMLLT